MGVVQGLVPRLGYTLYCSGQTSPRLIGLDQQGNPVESDKFFVYLVNSETNEVKDKIQFDICVAGRMDFFDLAVNKLIKDHGGILAHEKIITSYHNPEELHLLTQWKRL